jgi:CHAT domain-containing protein/tetratricopeptide (TPR) repeat protein
MREGGPGHVPGDVGEDWALLQELVDAARTGAGVIDTIVRHPELTEDDHLDLIDAVLDSARSRLPLDAQGVRFSDGLRVARRAVRLVRAHGVGPARTLLQAAEAGVDAFRRLVDAADTATAAAAASGFRDEQAVAQAGHAWTAVMQHPTRLLVLPALNDAAIRQALGVIGRACAFAPSETVLQLRLSLLQEAIAEPPETTAAESSLWRAYGNALSELSEFHGTEGPMRAAVTAYRRALELAPADERAELLRAVGAAHRDCYHHTRHHEDLETAIALFRESASLVPEPLTRANLAVSLRDLADAADQAIAEHPDTSRPAGDSVSRPGDADRRAALDLLERLVADGDATDRHLPRYLFELASMLLDQLPQTPTDLDDRQTATLTRAVKLSTEALDLNPEVSVRLASLQQLARGLELVHRRSGSPDDLARLDETWDRIERLVPSGSQHAREFRLARAQHTLSRALESGSGPDLPGQLLQAAELAWQVVTHETQLDEGRSTVLHDQALTLAVQLDAIRSRTGDDAGLRDARITHLEDRTTPEARLGLARLLLDRAEATGSVTDATRAAELSLHTPGPVLAGLPASPGPDGGSRDRELLVRAHLVRFSLTAQETDLVLVWELTEQADPGAHHDFDWAASRVWNLLFAADAGPRTAPTAAEPPARQATKRPADQHDGPRSGHSPAAENLTDAVIVVCDRRQKAGPLPHDRDLDHLDLLTAALLLRGGRLGDRDDLRRATERAEQAIVGDAGPEERLAGLHRIAGARYRERYAIGGDPVDADAGIAHYEQAVHLAPAEDALRAMAWNGLGAALRARFTATGEINDLERAIVAYRRSVALIGDEESPRWAVGLSNLGNALRIRSELLDDSADLSEAVDVHRRAVAMVPEGHHERSTRLLNLGNALITRYRSTHDPADLDEGMAAHEAAVAAAAPGEADLPYMLSSLGTDYSLRFDLTEDVADLDAAVDHARRGVVAALPGTAASITNSARFASVLARRFDVTGRAEDRDEALVHFRAVFDPVGTAEPGLLRVAAVKWAWWAAGHEDWQGAAEAYRQGIRVAGDLVRGQFDRQDRVTWLRQIGSFTAQAAYGLSRAGDLQGAVLAVETLSAVSMSQVLELQDADLRWAAAHGDPHLAAEFRAAAARWRSALDAGTALDGSVAMPATGDPGAGGTGGVGSATARLGDVPDPEPAARKAQADLTRLAAELEALTGRTDLLGPVRFEDILAVAGGPVVYLVPGDPGGVALVVDPDEPETPVSAVDLPELTMRQVIRWVKAYLANAVHGTTTLNWWQHVEVGGPQLWTAVVEPLLAVLTSAAARNRTVCLVPCGLVELVSLTLAREPDGPGPEATPGRFLVDLADIRYAPNARVLAHVQRRVPPSPPESLLAVADPWPAAGSRLPAALPEVAASAALYPQATILTGDAATPEAVRDQVPRFDVLHLACHASAHVTEPLASALHLAGGDLTLREILDLRLAAAGAVRLVILSGCQTSVGQVGAPDEVTSLAGALLEAGVLAVVASQWPVPDVSTALLMLRFQQLWRVEGLSGAAALRGAQRWLRDTSNEQAAQFVRAATAQAGHRAARQVRTLWRELIRRPPEDRSFAHPWHWAAFVYVGA